VREWLAMALSNPSAFCSPHTQDQSALSILLHNKSLPIVRPTPELPLAVAKSIEGFLRLLKAGEYSVSSASVGPCCGGGALAVPPVR
jgi:hypothetical protein